MPTQKNESYVAAIDDVPALVSEAGSNARFAYDEFFFARIRNKYTRKNYRHAVHQFLGWCERRNVALLHVSPRDVGEYLDATNYAPATKKVHLSALRHFFDELVLRHVVVLNPAASVRGERFQVIDGKTPEIGLRDARKLLHSIDDSNPVGKRDKAIIGTLVYTAARIGAVANLRRSNFAETNEQYVIQFFEKNGKYREIPVRHDLQLMVAAHLRTTDVDDQKSPLFTTALGRTGRLTDRAMTANDMSRMVKRRMKAAGLPERLSPHSFRVAIITDLLQQGVPLADVQHLAGHADPRTTRLYDRRQRRITRNIVERISI